MKKFYCFYFCLALFLVESNSLSAQMQLYGLSKPTPAFAQIKGTAGATEVCSPGGNQIAFCNDQTVTDPCAIGFNFVFDGATYTQFQATDNGCLFFSNAIAATCGNPDGVTDISNSLADAGSFPRPFLAPLWDEQCGHPVATFGSCQKKMVGAVGSRTLTVEWLHWTWRCSGTNDAISFQVILYEGTNIIDFNYLNNAGALSTVPTASVGLGGINSGSFNSVNNLTAASTLSSSSATNGISAKPAVSPFTLRFTPPTPVPIELINFKGQNIERGNFVEWETASETNNKIFILERSSDGENFQAIYNIKGRENNSSINKYNYLDTDLFPPSSNYYYRLKQTDFDGRFSYSNIINVTMNSLFEKKAYLYFDNNMNLLTIKYKPYGTENIDVIIHDVSGRILYEHSHEVSEEKSTIPISLSTLTNGLYIVKISGNNVLLQSKFIR